MTDLCIYLFRHDLRIADLPGLAAAAQVGRILPVFILDDDTLGENTPGGASRWWLHHSLAALSADITATGGRLVLQRGDTARCLQRLVAQTGAAAVYCSRGYAPHEVALEKALHAALTEAGVDFKRFPGTLLFEPEAIANQAGQPFKVFSPFWRHCLRGDHPAQPLVQPQQWPWVPDIGRSDDLDSWNLLPRNPDWAAEWHELWTPGTAGARERLAHFLDDGVSRYADGRDRPAEYATSRLSAHLHFGEISPREVWHRARQRVAQKPALESQVDKFLSEIGWREFSNHLLFHFPTIPREPFKAQFAGFPWLGGKSLLQAWQRGQTGYPVVDAGMRELWQTGYMHNRMRMVTASFLTKHLLIHWREGERWFWDTLVDADLAANACSWQWAAGSGADAAPYFRIFNPVTQGQKFDTEGEYVRRWVPELARLPDRYLHRPWEAPAPVLAEAGVVLGDHYPAPVVDHREAREAALAAYQQIRSG
ncbi:deoxyribodipyrimidine photolyase [Kineobactrum sediminis]|uniref:Deoxyribodipyrimidine photo-lyase n=1 Tax=Kineobactrum sediminis TaxID=1905677 RepID=A0A2N5Y1B5_9GAMM|nr:deoxyribodipyrimidine photo-lyase [Kineobactrum sediminis]PLW82174.1 deoxyribodipyrimidine photolyase [Kineobactrum sediminis]